ncbi:hypothetical protein AeMF1_004865 [Aphanomyces euteiches]|nr:hypothetical protein AeMF1_004865 [Aphanomyces euteiches]KAH9190003.1 hypothetical protein AeNC1_008019 [Aphanomyces euteiches]
MPRRKYFQSSRDEPASREVLMSPDILRLICEFQPGQWEDILPILPLEAHDNFWPITIYHMEEIGAVLTPWLNLYGLERVPRLLAAFPFMKIIALAHAAHVGHKQLVDAVAKIAPVLALRLKKRVKELVAIAIDSNQVGGIASLHCIEYRPEKYLASLVFGIGLAVSRRHMQMARYLATEVNKIDSQALKVWFNRASRDHMQMNLTTIFDTKNFEGLQWLLTIWSNLLPPRWMSRCRRECRTLALRHEAWEILVLLTKDESNPAAKYDEDLFHAAKFSYLEGVQWLLRTAGVFVKYRHIVEAAKRFQQFYPYSNAIFERLLANWLPTATDLDKKVICLDACMNEALKRRNVEAIQMIWTMGASKSTLKRYGTPSTLKEFSNLGVFTHGQQVSPSSHWSSNAWVSTIIEDANDTSEHIAI